MRLLSRTCIVVAAAVGLVGSARAQGRPLPPLPAQLAPDTRAAIQRLVDSAAAVGLPAAALVDKAAEGVLKGADDRRVLAAVQTLMRQLTDARDMLGSAKDVALLGATAGALQAGVPPAELRRLVNPAAGVSPEPRPLAAALVTLVDLVAKHVPPTTASSSIQELLKRRATEDQYVSLRNDVERDILGGQAPEAALAARTRAYVKVLDATSLNDRSLPRRPPPPPVG